MSAALEWLLDELVPRVSHIFADLLDYTLPMVSLLKGERITAATSEAAGGRDIEDLLVDGEVDIVRLHADGTEERLATLGVGQYFGELSPLLGFPRSASARARTDCALTACSAQEFRQQVLQDPIQVVEDSIAASSPSTPAVGTAPPH